MAALVTDGEDGRRERWMAALGLWHLGEGGEGKEGKKEQCHY